MLHPKPVVLVVDDSNAIRHLLSSILSTEFDVVATHDGLEAFAWMMRGHIPAAIVLDLNMPRLDGQGLLENIRNSGFFKDIPVVVLTSLEEEEVHAQCKGLGANAILTKPFNPLRLRRVLTELVPTHSIYEPN
ncbi:MAG: hypothetical protein KatS3mg029_1025 [Saprospiraceae bacterium]|nr:MAG: hypothetical protein KatS3mg029_1025 [Saprospiraceae bacterium]